MVLTVSLPQHAQASVTSASFSGSTNEDCFTSTDDFSSFSYDITNTSGEPVTVTTITSSSGLTVASLPGLPYTLADGETMFIGTTDQKNEGACAADAASLSITTECCGVVSVG